MTIKEKLKSMKSTDDPFYTRECSYQGIDFKISPLDYVVIYGTKSDFERNKPTLKASLLDVKNINQLLLDHEFEYFTLQRPHQLDSRLDLVFILHYKYEDNSKLNMNINV